MLSIVCKCGKTYQVDERHAGRSARCRRCGERLVLPKSDAGPLAPPSPPVEPPATAAAADLQETGQPRATAASRRRPPSKPVERERGHPYEAQGGYDLVREFAQGGQGKISLARDKALKRDVALKELLESAVQVPENQRRFLAEAEITAQLEHPGVVPIYALGTDRHGKPFYAMRFVEGQTLKEAIDAYRQSPTAGQLKALLRRFVMACQTIAYAHARGVIHRDLKPSNIMLGRFGETLVMDWGIAKPIRDGESDDSTLGALAHRQLAERGDLTAADHIVGTPAYMPPEQALGESDKLDATADVYSLGAVLYHILTGTPPYAGGSSLEVLKQVASSSPPPPTAVDPRAPRALEAICLKAMARERADRYSSASELADSVQAWLDDEPVAAYREPWQERVYRTSRKHKAAVATGAIVFLTAVLLGSVATIVVERERDKARAVARQADDYKRQADKAQQKAREKEAEADRADREAVASRRDANDAVQKEAEARQLADEREKKVAMLSEELETKAGEAEEIHKRLAAARAELAAVQAQADAESKRADAAASRAVELQRQAVTLRAEADELRTLASNLSRLAARLVEPGQAPVVAEQTPWDDFAQRDPATFDVVAGDGKAGAATADATRSRSSGHSLRVSTEAGGDVYVTYPRSRDADWDLSKYEYLSFAFSIADADATLREEGIAVRIGRGSQSIEYLAHPEVLSMSWLPMVPHGWAHVRVPLAGDPLWTRNEIHPRLDLRHVDWVELQFSTTSPRLTVWLDDFCFGDTRRTPRPLFPDPDRAAAEYAVSMKAFANVWVSGKTFTIGAATDIPTEPFTLTFFWAADAPHLVNDETLRLFAALPDCTGLGLPRQDITDQGLAQLSNLKNLWYLWLEGTGLTDAGCELFANHPKLTELHLGSTRLTDAGLAAIARVPNLGALNLHHTRVTDEGMKQLGARRSLSLLDISYTPVTAEGLRHLRNLPLDKLTLATSNSPFGLAVLEGVPLRKLTVRADRAEGAIEDSFLASLRLFPWLSQVTLEGAALSEGSVKRLSEMEGLRDLRFNNVRGSESALKGIATLSKLDALSVTWSGGINGAILEAWGAMTNLKSLSLENSAVEPASVLKLQETLPNCIIKVNADIQQAIDKLRAK